MKNVYRSLTNIVATAIAGLALAGASPALADNYFEEVNGSPALRVWNGGTGNVVVAVATNGAQLIVTTDGNATTLTGASYDTVAEAAAGIAACTNRDGAFRLTVDSSVALAADSVDAELLDGGYTGAPNAWLEIPWNSTNALHYDVSLPSGSIRARGSELNIGREAVPGKVAKVYGAASGTGNVTLGIYVNGSLKFSKSIVSPKYVLGAGNTNVADNVVFVDEAPQIPYGPQDSVLIRATRATTLTTGNLGVITEPKTY